MDSNFIKVKMEEFGNARRIELNNDGILVGPVDGLWKVMYESITLYNGYNKPNHIILCDRPSRQIFDGEERITGWRRFASVVSTTGHYNEMQFISFDSSFNLGPYPPTGPTGLYEIKVPEFMGSYNGMILRPDTMLPSDALKAAQEYRDYLNVFIERMQGLI